MNDFINELTEDSTNDTMNKNIQSQTKKKSKGITGRSSNKDILQRKKICKEIIRKSPGITKLQFIKLYRKECTKAKIKIPAQPTILKDARSCKIAFDRKGNSMTSPIFSSFNRIGYDIGYYLSQIRVLCPSYDITVFDIREDNITNITRTLPLKKFLSRIDSIYTTNTNDSNNYQKINNTSLTTILLIFNEKGLENYIESIFEQEFQINKPYLYTETSGYCFKIIFEFQDLKLIMRNVYGILEFTQPSYFSQEN